MESATGMPNGCLKFKNGSDLVPAPLQQCPEEAMDQAVEDPSNAATVGGGYL